MSASDLQAADRLGTPATIRAGRSSLPAAGAVAVLVAAAVLGGIVDVVTGPGLRLGFAVGLALGAAAAALLVRPSGLPAVVVAPPLVAVAGCLLFVVAAPGGGGTKGALLDIATGYLTYGFPGMATATGIAVLVLGFRLARGTH